MQADLGKIKYLIRKPAERHGLKFVILFGSFANGSTREKSDIDIAILHKSHRPIFYNSFIGIYSDFLDIFSDEAARIDLVDLAQANILLRHEIASTGTLIYGNEEDYENYRIFAIKDYIDSGSIRDLERIIIDKRQKYLASHLNA